MRRVGSPSIRLTLLRFVYLGDGCPNERSPHAWVLAARCDAELLPQLLCVSCVLPLSKGSLKYISLALSLMPDLLLWTPSVTAITLLVLHHRVTLQSNQASQNTRRLSSNNMSQEMYESPDQCDCQEADGVWFYSHAGICNHCHGSMKL